MSAAFSAIIKVEALVLADGIDGMIEASATRRPSSPWTLNSESTTVPGVVAGPIRAVQIMWYTVVPF